VAAEEPELGALLDDLQSVAAQFWFMQPSVAAAQASRPRRALDAQYLGEVLALPRCLETERLYGSICVQCRLLRRRLRPARKRQRHGKLDRANDASSDNLEVTDGFCHGVRTIAGPEFCLRLFEVATDCFFAEAECLRRFL
jgi:hypothetical protein